MTFWVFLARTLPKCVPDSLFFAQAYIVKRGFSSSRVFIFSYLLCLEIRLSSREFPPLSPLWTFSILLLWSCLRSSQRISRPGLFSLSRSSGWRVSQTRFDYCVQSLKEEVAKQVLDLIRNPPVKDPYRHLKDWLLRMFALNGYARAEAIDNCEFINIFINEVLNKYE